MAAMRMPWSTPKKTTPTVATSERSSAVLRTRAKRRRTAMSASEIAAMMTTAASAVCGRSVSSPGTNRSMRATRPAPTRPVTCVLAPDCSATAVREPLTEIAKPWNRPAPTLEAPTAIISRFASTSSPRRAAKLDDVAMVSVSETSTMPTAAAASVGRSLALVHGNEGVGRPGGSVPDRLHALGREVEARPRPPSPPPPRPARRGSSSRRAAGRAAARVCRGRRGASSCSSGRGSRRTPRPRRRSVSASVEKPKSLGSWPTMIVMASPFM